MTQDISFETPTARAKKFYQQGLVYETENLMGEAVRHYRFALKEDPFYPPALVKMGDYYQQNNELDLALQYFQQALEKTEPGKAQAPILGRVGSLLLRRQYIQEGERALQIALKLDPGYRPIYFHLAHHYYNCHYYEGARSLFLKYLDLVTPEENDYWRIIVLQYLIQIAQMLGEEEQAEHLFTQYSETFPALQLNRLTPPLVFSELAAAGVWRDQFEKRLAEFEALELDIKAPLWEILHPGHLQVLAQPGDFKAALETCSRIYRKFLAFEPKRFPKKEFQLLRIGVYTSFSSEALHLFQDLFQQLNSEFEINFYTHATPPQALENSKWQIYILPQNLSLQQQLIQEHQLDMLIYSDIGPDQLTPYLLAHAALAPVQVVLPGFPMTTGIGSLDYLLLPERMAVAQEGFTEKIRTFPGTPFKQPPPLELGPSPLRLPEDLSHWYLCPVSARRIQPEMDAILLGILAADPLAKIALLGEPAIALQRQFKARLVAQSPDCESQLFFLPPLKPKELLNTIAHFPVILDPLYWGLDVLALDLLSLGVPIVSWPQATYRSRFVAGLIEAMSDAQLTVSLLADSAESYITQAVQLSTDPAQRQNISQAILAHWPDIFDFQGFYREFRLFIREQCPRNF